MRQFEPRTPRATAVDTPKCFASFRRGELSEWSKVRDSKSRVPRGTKGSNPLLSATFFDLQVDDRRSPCPKAEAEAYRKADSVWRGDRVVEGARLEIVCTVRYRGFESLPLRQFMVLPTSARETRQARKGATVAVTDVWRGHFLRYICLVGFGRARGLT